MNDALILAFNIDDAAFEKLEHLCGALGLAVRRVPKAAFSLPLGALLGMPAARLTNAPNAGDFDDPMLVMCNLEEEPFNLFLQGAALFWHTAHRPEGRAHTGEHRLERRAAARRAEPRTRPGAGAGAPARAAGAAAVTLNNIYESMLAMRAGASVELPCNRLIAGAMTPSPEILRFELKSVQAAQKDRENVVLSRSFLRVAR